MTFSRQMLDMMPQTITVQAFSALSTDGYGSRTHSTDSKTVKCYVEDKTVLTRDALTGRETVSTRQIYCAPFDTTTGPTTVRIQISDKITTPSTDFMPRNPPIINVVHYDDRNGFYGQQLLV